MTRPTKAGCTSLREKRKRFPSNKPKCQTWTRQDGEIHGPGYKIGYTRLSTLDQNLALQQDALKEAGCANIFIEQMSGAASDRPALREALDFARSGDTLIVWKLDRLARRRSTSRRNQGHVCSIRAHAADHDKRAIRGTRVIQQSPSDDRDDRYPAKSASHPFAHEWQRSARSRCTSARWLWACLVTLR